MTGKHIACMECLTPVRKDQRNTHRQCVVNELAQVLKHGDSNRAPSDHQLCTAQHNKHVININLCDKQNISQKPHS